MIKPSFSLHKNKVATVKQPPGLVLLLPDSAAGWCDQYAQEGYDVVQIRYPLETTDQAPSFKDTLSDAFQQFAHDFGVITFGIEVSDAIVLSQLIKTSTNWKTSIHYCPEIEDASVLLTKDSSGKYPPTLIHVASSQEALHLSLSLTSEPTFLGYELPTSSFYPISFFSYPGVPASPPFPLLTKAPALVVAGEQSSSDPYLRSATGLAYTRSLEILRRELGPHFPLEKLWDAHTYYEFVERDAIKTMSTMVQTPYVNHVPTMTGGVGYNDLARFYKYHFTANNITPPDTELLTVSRTVGADRIIDEMIYKCTHTTEIDYFLPGVKPTGKPLEIAIVGVVAFRGDKLTFDARHIYWDQASTLVQLGLLDPQGLPVAGLDVARKVVDPFVMPSNALMQRWKDSDGLSIL